MKIHTRLLFVWIYCSTCQILSTECRGSRITFQSGAYNNIFIGLDENVDVTQCEALITEIQRIFDSASTYLRSVTSNQATFGTIYVILPPQWRNQLQFCRLQGSQVRDSDYDTYDEADFKVTTTHPFAKSVPWTKQYRGCGESAESVLISTDFLRNYTHFDLEAKGRHLLHEWMKFRYGVFEEFGYYDDPSYSPCYTKNKMLHYSSCTSNNGGISPIGDGNEDVTPEQCRTLVEESIATLRAQLSRTKPSIMYNPYLSNGHHLCTNVNHNGMNPTKQNVLCDRKSVADIMKAHPDLIGSSFVDDDSAESLLPPAMNFSRQTREVRLEFVMQKTPSPAYFVVIENSVQDRQFHRLRHVKQAMAEFLRLTPDGSLVHLMDYASLQTIEDIVLINDEARITILNKLKAIPDGGVQSSSSNTSSEYASNPSSRALNDVFTRAISIMDGQKFRKWELVLIVSSTPTTIEFNEALAILARTDYPVSVMTFGDSRDWLRFNSIYNTRKIVHLPYCFSQVDDICHGRTSALITDHLLELVNGLKLATEQYRRYFHKVVDFEVTGPFPTSFTIPSLVADSRNFYLFMPIYDGYTNASVSREGSPQVCYMTKLLDYDGILTMNCTEFNYMTGNWIVTITGSGMGRRRTHVIRGYVETSGTPRDLNVLTSYGFNTENEIFPRMNHRFPIYVSVTNTLDQPIIYATAELRIVYQQGTAIFTSNTSIQMLDDGEDPDITKNDGIYSAFITTFSSTPAFHSGYITVTTNAGSRSVQGYLNEAALLDPVANSRCCGSVVQFSDSQLAPVEYAKYSRVIPTFRTGESFDPGENIIPPSRIQSKIKVIAEDKEFLTLEFRAPGADHKENIVSYYSVCCTAAESGNLDDAMCANVDTSGCTPVGYNETQECTISLVAMYDAFYDGQKPENETSATLYCGLRGIDVANNAGPISSFIFEMVLEFEAIEDFKAASDECKSIGDKCLPIWIFWVLIGCVAFLLLVVLVILICWCLTARKGKSETDKGAKKDKPEIVKKETIKRENKQIASPTDPTPPSPKLPPGPIPLHKVYINNAYIQDTNEHLQLVASDGQFVDKNHDWDSAGFEDHDERRNASIQRGTPVRIGANRFGNKRYGSQPSIVESPDSNPEKQDMPIFFTKTSAVPAPQRSPSKQTSQENIYARANSGMLPPRYSHNLRDRVPIEEPVPKSRQPRPNNPYKNPRFSPPSRDGPELIQSPAPRGDMNPIYASVSRNGPGLHGSSQRSLPMASPYHVSSASRDTGSGRPGHYSPQHTPPPPPVSRLPDTGRGPPKTMKPVERVPLNEQSRTGSMGQKIIPLPPVRLDHFPSSESETYSDMSHIVPLAKKPDRTLPPANSNSMAMPPQTNQKYQTHQTSQSQRDRNISQIKQQPPPLPKTPPNHNRFGPRRGVRGSANRPQFLPPPPPRRQNQDQSFDNTVTGSNGHGHLNRSGSNHNMDEYYDDDSDEWGNYDDEEEIAFPPIGHSYA